MEIQSYLVNKNNKTVKTGIPKKKPCLKQFNLCQKLLCFYNTNKTIYGKKKPQIFLKEKINSSHYIGIRTLWRIEFPILAWLSILALISNLIFSFNQLLLIYKDPLHGLSSFFESRHGRWKAIMPLCIRLIWNLYPLDSWSPIKPLHPNHQKHQQLSKVPSIASKAF